MKNVQIKAWFSFGINSIMYTNPMLTLAVLIIPYKIMQTIITSSECVSIIVIITGSINHMQTV